MTKRLPGAAPNLPAIGRLLAREDAQALIERFGKGSVTEALRAVVADARAREESLSPDDAVSAAERSLGKEARGTLSPVINATGVLLHTNLGRAPLARAAVDASASVGAGYGSIELDLATGERGSRHVHAKARLVRLTGAEDAIVTNNAAAALLLALSALAEESGGKRARVVVSRGELVEIGGAFRIPEIIEVGGATLAEVGTTNRTRIGDYARALDALAGEPTPVLLKVHRSNFAIVGYTEEATVVELAALARAREKDGVRPSVVFDLGSGLLVPGRDLGLPDEPDVPAAIADGADVVVFSGDKLLGGPQAGLAVGRANAIARLRRHPLMRAVRAGKLVLAALDATLALYERGARHAFAEVPVLRMLVTDGETVKARVDRLQNALGGEVVASVARVGAGAQPTATVPSFALRLPDARPTALATALRGTDPIVIGRVEDGALLLDGRALEDRHLDAVIGAVHAARATL